MKIDLSDRKNMFYWQTNRPLSADETKKIFLNRHEQVDRKTLNEIVEYGMKSAGYKGDDILIKEDRDIIKSGSVNSVIPIILKSGKKIVLRIHPRNVKNGYYYVEKIATTLVKNQGVPTYETIFIDDSQKVVPHDFMITTAVIGRPMFDFRPFTTELEKTLVTETGKYAALISNIKTEGFGFFDNQLAKSEMTLRGQYDSFKEHIYAALTEDLKYLVDHAVFTTNKYKDIEKLFQKNVHLMDCRQGSLVHNDIADWNELSDGKSITGIMDWDECFSGDPLMEIAAYNLFFDEPRMTWFNEGYKQIKKIETNEDKFQLFKLRYLISKMHLRTKRSLIDSSSIMKQNIERGMIAMNEVFKYFKL